MKVAGFRFAGVAAGIKKKGGKDVGLIAADAPVAAAAVFTGNRVKAAPVLLSAAHLKASRGRLRGVVVNSGNANACTGAAGAADARTMAAAAAAAIGGKPGEQLVASTGVIGQPLPIARVQAGVAAAGAALSAGRWLRRLRRRDPHDRSRAQGRDPHGQARPRAGDAGRLHQGRRHDRAQHGHDAVVRVHRRRDRARARWPAPPGPRSAPPTTA